MNVANILADKGNRVITITGDVTLLDAARSLSDNKIGAIVDSKDGVRVEGIISERDIVNAIARNDADILSEAVSRFMTAKVVTCSNDDVLHNLMEKMTTGRFRHLPVVNNGQLGGIVSIGNVVKRRILETEMEADAMRQYISAG